MHGPPVKIATDPKIEPKASHKPVPVPLHWQAKVKAGLEEDVNKGVLEEFLLVSQ